jgi:hypothetical protein
MYILWKRRGAQGRFIDEEGLEFFDPIQESYEEK